MLYLVTGPPASGKSTWVREHANHGDITIDYDALAATLTPAGGKPHAWPTEVKAVVKAARKAAIDTALRHSTTVDVYIIHSSLSTPMLNHYLAHGAQVITIDPGMATVMARCKAERPWQMQQAVKQWYTNRPANTPTAPANTTATAMGW